MKTQRHLIWIGFLVLALFLCVPTTVSAQGELCRHSEQRQSERLG